MNDEWTSFITVSFFMGLMIILCVYLQDFALVKKDWANLKCNPLYMFIHSVSAPNKRSVDTFKNCVVNV